MCIVAASSAHPRSQNCEQPTHNPRPASRRYPKDHDGAAPFVGASLLGTVHCCAGSVLLHLAAINVGPENGDGHALWHECRITGLARFRTTSDQIVSTVFDHCHHRGSDFGYGLRMHTSCQWQRQCRH